MSVIRAFGNGRRAYLVAAALLLLCVGSSCSDDPVRPQGTVEILIRTVVAGDPAEPAGVSPADDARGILSLAAVDRVNAVIVAVRGGEVLANQDLAINGNTASGRIVLQVTGSVEADLRIRMWDAGSLAYQGVERVTLVAGGRLTPTIVLRGVPPSGVRGEVLNRDTGAAVVGAFVRLTDPDPDVLTTTSLVGGFSIAIAPGIYTLSIDAIGFVSPPDTQVTIVDTTFTDIGAVLLAPSNVTTGIRGQVRDAATQQAIGGATVRVLGTGQTTETGSTGQFQLELLPGSYALVVEAEGYDPAQREVGVGAIGVTEISDILLTPSTPPSGVRGLVVSNQSQLPIEGATVRVINTSLSVQTRPSGVFQIELDPGNYTLEVTATDFEPAERSFAVADTGFTDVGTIALMPMAGAPGTLTGRVENAQQVEPIQDATVTLVGTAVSVQTGTDGRFELSAPSTTYTLRVTAAGFVSQDRQVTIIANESTDLGVIALVPQQAQGEIAIVLTWGTSPGDLDAHLTGPSATGGRFHVYFGAPGSRTAPPFAILDRDVQSGLGPETITIVQRTAGIYRYSVHDYSNRFATPNNPSSALSASEARVRVVVDNQEVANIPVPTGQNGTLWRVLEIDGTSGQITTRNTFEYQSDPSAID